MVDSDERHIERSMDGMNMPSKDTVFNKKAMSLKKKLQILELLDKNVFDYEKIQELLSYASIPGLTKPILKSIFHNLVLLDTQVSASYDLLSEEEWDSLEYSYETPPDSLTQCHDTCGNSIQDNNIRNKIEILNTNFPIFLEELSKNKIENILDILIPIFKNKTKNMQFILFKIAKIFPRHVFGYLMAKVKSEPRVYAPFYCSLLARLKIDNIDNTFKLRCHIAYVKHLKSLKISKNLDFIVLSQYLLYSLCFNREFFNESKDLIDDIHRAGVFSYMSKDVVDRFCNIFNYYDVFKYKISAIENNRNECLQSFPFDYPICKAIQQEIDCDYVAFTK